MRALSIRQPWVSLIMSGKKTIEVRTWSTDYRGILAVHAAARSEHPRALELADVDGARGAYVGVVQLVDVRPWEPEDFLNSGSVDGMGSFAWVLRRPRLFNVSIPGAGRLGLFVPPLEVWKPLERIA